MKKRFLAVLYISFVLLSSSFTVQLFKTSLKINVRNDLGNIVSGAKVTLFDTREDYEKSENALDTKTTDSKGYAVFENLEPKIYYISAEKGDANNFGAGEKTDSLAEKRMNKVTIIISE